MRFLSITVCYTLLLCCVTCVGVDQWFPLKPISKDDEIQGELLVEIMIDEYSEVIRERGKEREGGEDRETEKKRERDRKG